MITLDTDCITTLPCRIKNIKSIVYDGWDYAALRHQRVGITRLDERFCCLGTYGCSLTYSCLCFDQQTCCYYAFVEQVPSIVYVLDINFDIIENLTITTPHATCPCAMSVCPKSSVLYLLYEDEILVWDKYSNQITNRICLKHNDRVLDIIALQYGYLLSYELNKQFFIEVVCDYCEPSHVYAIPCEYELLSMISMEQFYYDDHHCDISLQLLLSSCHNDEQLVLPLYLSCHSI